MTRRDETQKYTTVTMYTTSKERLSEKAKLSGRSLIGLLEVIADRLIVDERGGVSMGSNGNGQDEAQR